MSIQLRKQDLMVPSAITLATGGFDPMMLQAQAPHPDPQSHTPPPKAGIRDPWIFC